MDEAPVKPRKKRRIGRIIFLILLAGGAFYLYHIQQKNNAAAVSELTKKAEADHATAPTAEADHADPTDPTKNLIEAQVVDLSQIAKVSRYRSGALLDYSSGNDETCRSLRHSFAVAVPPAGQRPANYATIGPDTANPVHVMSPVAGTISQVTTNTISIIPTRFPRMVVKLDRVFPAELTANSPVEAGQVIGSIGKYGGVDVSIEIPAGPRTDYFSYFDVMPDSLFRPLTKFGIDKREQVIIDRAQRDSRPLTCQNGKFTDREPDDPSDWLTLTPQG